MKKKNTEKNERPTYSYNNNKIKKWINGIIHAASLEHAQRNQLFISIFGYE